MSSRRRRSCLKQANGQEKEKEDLGDADSNAALAPPENDLALPNVNVTRIIKRRVSFSAKNEVKEFRKDVSSDVTDSSNDTGMDMTMLTEPTKENACLTMYDMSMDMSIVANTTYQVLNQDHTDQNIRAAVPKIPINETFVVDKTQLESPLSVTGITERPKVCHKSSLVDEDGISYSDDMSLCTSKLGGILDSKKFLSQSNTNYTDMSMTANFKEYPLNSKNYSHAADMSMTFSIGAETSNPKTAFLPMPLTRTKLRKSQISRIESPGQGSTPWKNNSRNFPDMSMTFNVAQSPSYSKVFVASSPDMSMTLNTESSPSFDSNLKSTVDPNMSGTLNHHMSSLHSQSVRNFDAADMSMTINTQNGSASSKATSIYSRDNTTALIPNTSVAQNLYSDMSMTLNPGEVSTFQKTAVAPNRYNDMSMTINPGEVSTYPNASVAQHRYSDMSMTLHPGEDSTFQKTAVAPNRYNDMSITLNPGEVSMFQKTAVAPNRHTDMSMTMNPGEVSTFQKTAVAPNRYNDMSMTINPGEVSTYPHTSVVPNRYTDMSMTMNPGEVSTFQKTAVAPNRYNDMSMTINPGEVSTYPNTSVVPNRYTDMSMTINPGEVSPFQKTAAAPNRYNDMSMTLNPGEKSTYLNVPVARNQYRDMSMTLYPDLGEFNLNMSEDSMNPDMSMTMNLGETVAILKATERAQDCLETASSSIRTNAISANEKPSEVLPDISVASDLKHVVSHVGGLSENVSNDLTNLRLTPSECRPEPDPNMKAKGNFRYYSSQGSPLNLPVQGSVSENSSASFLASVSTSRDCNKLGNRMSPLNLTKHTRANPVLVREVSATEHDIVDKPQLGAVRKKRCNKPTIPVPHNSAFGKFGSAKTPKRQLPQDIFSRAKGVGEPKNLQMKTNSNMEIEATNASQKSSNLDSKRVAAKSVAESDAQVASIERRLSSCSPFAKRSKPSEGESQLNLSKVNNKIPTKGLIQTKTCATVVPDISTSIDAMNMNVKVKVSVPELPATVTTTLPSVPKEGVTSILNPSGPNEDNCSAPEEMKIEAMSSEPTIKKPLVHYKVQADPSSEAKPMSSVKTVIVPSSEEKTSVCSEDNIPLSLLSQSNVPSNATTDDVCSVNTSSPFSTESNSGIHVAETMPTSSHYSRQLQPLQQKHSHTLPSSKNTLQSKVEATVLSHETSTGESFRDCNHVSPDLELSDSHRNRTKSSTSTSAGRAIPSTASVNPVLLNMLSAEASGISTVTFSQLNQPSNHQMEILPQVNCDRTRADMLVTSTLMEPESASTPLEHIAAVSFHANNGKLKSSQQSQPEKLSTVGFASNGGNNGEASSTSETSVKHSPDVTLELFNTTKVMETLRPEEKHTNCSELPKISSTNAEENLDRKFKVREDFCVENSTPSPSPPNCAEESMEITFGNESVAADCLQNIISSEAVPSFPVPGRQHQVMPTMNRSHMKEGINTGRNLASTSSVPIPNSKLLSHSLLAYNKRGKVTENSFMGSVLGMSRQEPRSTSILGEFNQFLASASESSNANRQFLPVDLVAQIDGIKSLEGRQKIRALERLSSNLQNLTDEQFKVALTELTGFAHPHYIAYEQQLREFSKVNTNQSFDVTDPLHPSILYSKNAMARFKRNL